MLFAGSRTTRSLPAEELLQGRGPVDHRHHPLAVLGRVLLLHDDDVAVVDVVLDHRLAADLQGVVVLAAEQLAQVDPFVLRHRLKPATGRHQAEHRERRGANPQAGNGDRPGGRLLVLYALVPLDEALLLKGLEVAHDPVGRGDLERLADLPDRGREAAVLDLVPDEVQDLVLPFRDGRTRRSLDCPPMTRGRHRFRG